MKNQNKETKRENPNNVVNEYVSTAEFSEIRNLLLEQNLFLSMLIPAWMSVPRLCEITGKSRQAIRNYILNHFEPEVDFNLQNGKIFVSKNVAVQILARGVK